MLGSNGLLASIEKHKISNCAHNSNYDPFVLFPMTYMHQNKISNYVQIISNLYADNCNYVHIITNSVL